MEKKVNVRSPDDVNGRTGHSTIMPALDPLGLEDAIGEVVARIPDWLRTGLSAHDPHLREQAEAALAAMIAAALRTAS